MEKHLKDRSYYENIYDHQTIRIMKNLEDINKWRNKKGGTHLWEFFMLMKKYTRYEHRSKTIEENMQRDKNRDEFYENTSEPFEVIRCKLCNTKMSLELKEFYLGTLWKQDKVLFMYRCINCRKWRAIYNDWAEFESEQESCKKCNEIIDYKWKFEWDIFIKKYHCESCWIKYTKKEDFTSTYKEDNPITQKDIDKYWYSKKDEIESQHFHSSMNSLKDLILDKKDEEKEIEDNKKLEKIIKYNLYQIEEKIISSLKNTDFVNFKITKKDNVKTYLKCEFEVYYKWNDSIEINKKLDKLLKKTLSSSNWKLQEYKTTEKLWLLTWYLFWYDNREDLLKLTKF